MSCLIPHLCWSTARNDRGRTGVVFRAPDGTFGARPPGLIWHVLTVLVFWFRVLLPGSRASFWSIRVRPLTIICFMAPSSKFLDPLPPTPRPPVQKHDAQHMILQHEGAHTDTSATTPHFVEIACSSTTTEHFGIKLGLQLLSSHHGNSLPRT